MKIPIKELKQMIHEYMTAVGMDTHDSEILQEIIVEQELIGNQFSPVGELAGKHQRLVDKLEKAKEEIVVDKQALQLLKSNGRLAPLHTAY